VGVEQSVEEAIEIMGENQIRRIPVVDKNQVCVGIISQADLLSRLIETEALMSAYRILGHISAPHGQMKEAEPAKPPAKDKKKKDKAVSDSKDETKN
jgi:CBS-domain-containing membrane protein